MCVLFIVLRVCVCVCILWVLRLCGAVPCDNSFRAVAFPGTSSGVPLWGQDILRAILSLFVATGASLPHSRSRLFPWVFTSAGRLRRGSLRAALGLFPVEPFGFCPPSSMSARQSAGFFAFPKLSISQFS